MVKKILLITLAFQGKLLPSLAPNTIVIAPCFNGSSIPATPFHAANTNNLYLWVLHQGTSVWTIIEEVNEFTLICIGSEESGSHIVCSPEQEFLVDNKSENNPTWRKAQDLKTEDLLTRGFQEPTKVRDVAVVKNTLCLIKIMKPSVIGITEFNILTRNYQKNNQPSNPFLGKEHITQ